jgi:hypothetical protein
MRNWKKVNGKYIHEGELYLSFDFVHSWKREVKELNLHKEGARFKYPESLIRFCSVLKVVFGLGFRQEQGILQSLSGFIDLPDIISYTQIQRRINALGLDLVGSLANPRDGQVIAIDSTGIKLYNSGEWIREKHKKRKPFLKLHIAVNVGTKQAVSVGITEDSIGDHPLALPLIEQARQTGNVSTVLLDGAYDVRNLWKKLNDEGIKPVIRLRKNASPNGLGLRARMVRQRNRIGQKAWAEKHGYGQRWQAETWFSSYKRRFGEHCYSTKPKNIIHEIILKTILLNKLIP